MYTYTKSMLGFTFVPCTQRGHTLCDVEKNVLNRIDHLKHALLICYHRAARPREIIILRRDCVEQRGCGAQH